jgi:DNA helicase-2/ATP-dependent DNA helicase PcrA
VPDNSPTRFERDLNPQQLAAVTHEGGPCLVLAGAGSGKTRVITHRIAWLLSARAVPPNAICAVTFTNKAAAEMRQRVGELLGGEPSGLWLMTFHALGLRLLREAAGRPGAPPAGFAIYDRGDSLSLWKRCQSELRIDTSDYPPRQLFEACSRAQNALEDPRGWDQPNQPIERRQAARVYGAYRKRMRERRALDFDDLLVQPLRLLSTDSSWHRRVSERFRHLLVDEYQDTNQLQYRLVRALVGDTGALMVVGDEDQSIYRWRGADISNVLDFRSDFPGATVIRLEQNYRSTQPILRAAGSLIARNNERLGKNLWSDQEAGAKPVHMLLSSERQEAVWVARHVAAARSKGTPLSEIAVLFRVNAQSRPFEEEFAGRSTPFRVVGGPTFFRRAEVKDALAVLRLLVTEDDAALARAISTPRRGVGPAALTALASSGAGPANALFAALAGSDPSDTLRVAGVANRSADALVAFGRTILALRDRLGHDSLADLVRLALERVGYLEMLRAARDGEERMANLDELMASAAEFAGDGSADADRLVAFLDRTALISDVDAASSREGAVSLMTVHAAKGLEFDTVFVVGMEEGLLPHGSSIKEGHVEEERRLAYVAMTRARSQLFLSSARLRRLHGQERLQTPSRFLGEIDPGAIETDMEPGLLTGSSGSGRTHRGGGSRGGGGRGGGYRPGTTTERRTAPPKRVDPNARGTGVPAPGGSLQPGAAVFHPMFGPGRITGAQGSGDQLKVTVAFARAGTKELIARFAKLQLLA